MGVRAQQLVFCFEVHSQRPPSCFQRVFFFVQIKTFKDRLIFIDSLRFLVMRLKDMPKTFRAEEVKKRSFSYRLNDALYWDKVVALPTKEEFEVEFMSSRDKAEFNKWYAQNIFNIYM